MDQQENSAGSHAAPPPPPRAASAPVVYEPRRKGGLGTWLLRTFVGFIFVSSIVLNIYMGAMLASRLAGPFRKTVVRDGDGNQRIALYEVSGTIDDGQAAMFESFVRDVRDDDGIKAVVLRVNSPGGGVSASDQMHRNVLLLKGAGKRVVVSMGGTAASGGYYISAPADRIYAENTTITGSIGVIGMFPILKGTLDKIGMEVVIIKSEQAEQWKDPMNPFREPQPQDVAFVQRLLNQIQLRFNEVVAEGRSEHLSEGDLRQLTTGQVWLGPEARELRLVDEIGYLDDALDGAAELAELDNPQVVHYYRRPGLLEQLAAEGPGLRIDANLLDDIQTPRVMLLWKADR